MAFLDHLSWRYAVKEFDRDRKLDGDTLDKILDSVVMTPTSFGLEPYRVDIVSDEKVLEKLEQASFGQAQVGSCSHLLVFSARMDAMDRVDQYLEKASGGDEKVREKLEGYGDVMRGFFENKSRDEVLLWAQNQVHIALGFAMGACAELEVDSCAMGGFLPGKVSETLELEEKFVPTVLLPVGFRVEDPRREKFRFGADDILVWR